MKLIVHGPETAEELAELACRVSRLHGEAVVSYIRGLEISQEERLSLLQSIYQEQAACGKCGLEGEK